MITSAITFLPRPKIPFTAETFLSAAIITRNRDVTQLQDIEIKSISAYDLTQVSPYYDQLHRPLIIQNVNKVMNPRFAHSYQSVWQSGWSCCTDGLQLSFCCCNVEIGLIHFCGRIRFHQYGTRHALIYHRARNTTCCVQRRAPRCVDGQSGDLKGGKWQRHFSSTSALIILTGPTTRMGMAWRFCDTLIIVLPAHIFLEIIEP